MTFRKTMLTGLALALVANFSLAASAQDDPSNTEEFDIAAITCWDVMTLEESERTSALLLIYGYSAGGKETSVMSGASIEAALSNVMDFCADNPDTTALDALGQ